MSDERIGSRSDELVIQREADVCTPVPTEIETGPNGEREPSECHSYANEPDKHDTRKKLRTIAEVPYQKHQPSDPNCDNSDVRTPVTFGLHGRSGLRCRSKPDRHDQHPHQPDDVIGH